MMMSNINTCTGRVAVITGANKGIGYFIALQLGLSGLFQHILLGCRDTTRAASAVASIQAQLLAAASLTGDSSSTAVQVSSLPLTLGDAASHEAFVKSIQETYGKVDVLVNNAAMAYKGADPTPFQQQCKPTLDINYRGTMDLTQKLLPLVKKGEDARIVNVASMAGRLHQISSPELKQHFTSPDLTMPLLNSLVDQFEQDVLNGTHQAKGWGNSNYGFSKLAVIAATKVLARENPDIRINCCCPGYCKSLTLFLHYYYWTNFFSVRTQFNTDTYT
jgi:carbonyl reductase 1